MLARFIKVLPFFLVLNIYAEIKVQENTEYTFLIDKYKQIETTDVTLKVPISGITKAYDEYTIYATFDGQVVYVMCETSDMVKDSQILMKMVTGELAALLKTTRTPEEKKYILKRWKGLFKYSDVKAPERGIVTRIFLKNGDFVKKGDKLLTIARKMKLIAKNDKKMYMPPEQGLNAVVETPISRYKLTLKDFIKDTNNSYNYTFIFDFDELPDVKIGEQLKGELFIIKKENVRIVKKEDVIDYNGKKFILIEFEPGVTTEDLIEINSFKLNYLKVNKKEDKNGSK